MLYSPDRLEQLNKTIACLKDTEGFGDCEKILCVDGKSNVKLDGFEIIEIPRKKDLYCWADALNTGVKKATREIILYMDSDRIVPTSFLIKVQQIINRRCFVFLSRMYSLRGNVDLQYIRKLRNDINNGSLDKHKKNLKADHRTLNPLNIDKKNPMSGCVAFYQDDFLALGGFDASFVGWGYPDYDFFMNLTKNKYQLTPIKGVEIHQHHTYNIKPDLRHAMNAWNCARYHDKWKLPYPIMLKEKLKKYQNPFAATHEPRSKTTIKHM